MTQTRGISLDTPLAECAPEDLNKLFGETIRHLNFTTVDNLVNNSKAPEGFKEERVVEILTVMRQKGMCPFGLIS